VNYSPNVKVETNASHFVMARYKPKVPPADPKAVRSWIGKPVKDTKLNEFGLVHDILEQDDKVYILARFPHETESRKIALEPVDNMEYILPGDVRARYRPLSETDRNQLEALRRK